MSYSRNSLGFAATDTYPSGTQIVGGFQVVGLQPAAAGAAVQRLREAASAFPMGGVSPVASSGPNAGRATAGWGAAFGVPAGRLYVVITTNTDGVTGAQINAALGQVARALSSRLNGLRVNLTNSHAVGGAAPLPALTPDVDSGGNTLPGGSLSPLAIGGIAVGGLVVLGAIGFATFAFLRRRPVAANRRRLLGRGRVTRNGRISKRDRDSLARAMSGERGPHDPPRHFEQIQREIWRKHGGPAFDRLYAELATKLYPGWKPRKKANR